MHWIKEKRTVHYGDYPDEPVYPRRAYRQILMDGDKEEGYLQWSRADGCYVFYGRQTDVRIPHIAKGTAEVRATAIAMWRLQS